MKAIEVEKALRECMVLKQWRKAFSIIKSLGDDFNNSEVNTFVLKQARSAVGHLDKLEALYFEASRKDVEERVLSSLGVKGSVVETQRMEGGLMCVALFFHRVRLEFNDYISVVEKVYLPAHRSRVEKEVYLYNTFSAEGLCSPPLLGWSENNGFSSVFYRYVKGSKPSVELWNGSLRRFLLGHLWKNTQSNTVGCRGSEDEANEDLMSCIFNLEQAKISKCLAIASWLRVNYDHLRNRLAALPRFVMHGDFYPGNVLSQGGDFYLIDWDKWSMRPLGSGARGEWLGGEESGVYEFYTGVAESDIDLGAVEVQAFISSYMYFFRKNRIDVIDILCGDFMYRQNL